MMNKKNIKFFGNLLIATGIVLILYIFFPAAKEEITYNFQKAKGVTYTIDEPENKGEVKLEPANTSFSILIPKIGASAPVIAKVDTQNKDGYLQALRRGVAHAMGTPFPNENGNTYLFAHSTDSYYNFNQFNAVFYLIGKLQKDDEIYVYYQDQKITYKVDKVLVTSKDDSFYLGKIKDSDTLTLQTCYPPGTTLRRLIVVADKIEG